MKNNFTAKAEILIGAPATRVWNALTDPEIIKQYLFGTTAISDWKVGSRILYRGQGEGKAYEDKGTILEVVPEKRFVSTYWTAFSGLPDQPENYQTVEYDLVPEGAKTKLTVTQSKIPSQQSADQLKNNLEMVLGNLKKLLETGSLIGKSA